MADYGCRDCKKQGYSDCKYPNSSGNDKDACDEFEKR